MRNYNDAQSLAKELINTTFDLNLDGGFYRYNIGNNGYRFSWMKSIRSIGRCQHTTKEIQLSRQMVAALIKSGINEKVKDTILHEIAHAIARIHYGKGVAHDHRWETIARQIGCSANARFFSADLKFIKSKYTLICDNCGAESPRSRLPKRKHSCGICSTSFNEKFLLRVRKNY